MKYPAPNGFEARFAAIRAKRESQGLNVHFINADGRKDMMSMASADRADAVRANLKANGRKVMS